MKTFFFAWLFLPLAGFAETELSFLLRGKMVKKMAPSDLNTIVVAEEIEVWEPHESRLVRYRAFPVVPLFDKIYDKSWRSIEEVFFTCEDGYQPSVPVARFLKHRAYLAFKRADGSDFSLINKLQGGERVALGPYYLIWDNKNSEELRARMGEGWPYQVVKMDLVDPQDRFPKMAPPKNSNASVKRGFHAFRQHCAACHRMNGEGGAKAFDLNRPVSVTEYLKEPWLKRWILNPQEIRSGTTMPALTTPTTDKERIADEIISYLKAMASLAKRSN